MKHVNVFKHPVFFAIPLVFAWTIYSFSNSSFVSGDLFGVKKISKESDKKIEQKTEEKPVTNNKQMSLQLRDGVFVYSNRGGKQ